MPKIENFIFKKKVFNLPIEDNFGNTKNINMIMDALTNTQSTLTNDLLLNIAFKEKSGDKVETNQRQSGDKVETNQRQSGDKVETNQRQSGDKVETNQRQSRSRKEATLKQKIPLNKQKKSVFSILGTQQKIMMFFLERCKLNRSRCTGEISIISIKNSCKITVSSIKKTLQRLEFKRFIIRKLFKNGRGGWTIYEIPQNIFQELLSVEAKYKLETKLETANTISSSSSYIETSTMITSGITKKVSMFDEASPAFKITPLEDIGLTQSHILQLTTAGKLSPEQIQDSINFFAFDLAHNGKAKTLKKTPLEFFMGILRHGHPYAAPANYEAPEAESLRLYLESKQRVLKATEELETKAKDALFREWQQNLSPEDLEAFYVEDERLADIPESMRETLKRNNTLNRARQHFEATIWPEKRKRILEENKHPSPLAEGVSE